MADENNPLNLDKALKSKLIVDMLTRTIVHYGLWFTEVRHQMGMEKALDVLENATQKSVSIGMKKIAKVLEFELEDGLPKPLLDLK